MNPFEELEEQLLEALQAAGITRAIGGYDISMNEHAEEEFKPHWKPHAWIFVPKEEIKRGDREFRKHFPRSKRRVPKPVMVKRYNGSLTGIAYAIKGNFQRRVTLPKMVTKKGATSKRRNVRYRALRAHQKMELMLMLERVGLEARVMLYGVTVIETPKGQKVVGARNARHD